MNKDHRRSHRQNIGFSGEHEMFNPSTLQEYEYASEGAADRVITMARLEQEHRQRMEEETLEFYRFSYRFGQTCGLAMTMAAIAAIVYLSVSGKETLATFIAMVIFSTIAFAHVTSFFTVRRFLEPEMSLTGYIPPKPKKKKRPSASSRKKNVASKTQHASDKAVKKETPKASAHQKHSSKRRRKSPDHQQKHADGSKSAS